MKSISFDNRIYAGYPIFLLTYYDQESSQYNYAAYSSMYTLGSMAVIGLGNSNARKCIQESKRFTVSFLSDEFLEDIKLGGYPGSKLNKFSKSNLILDSYNSAKFIQQAQLVYDLEFIEGHSSKEFPEFFNAICEIKGVFVNDNSILDDSLDIEKFNPTFYFGTDKQKTFTSLK